MFGHFAFEEETGLDEQWVLIHRLLMPAQRVLPAREFELAFGEISVRYRFKVRLIQSLVSVFIFNGIELAMVDT